MVIMVVMMSVIERGVPAMVVVVAESIPWVIIERIIESIIIVSVIPWVAIERAESIVPWVISVSPWTVGP